MFMLICSSFAIITIAHSILLKHGTLKASYNLLPFASLTILGFIFLFLFFNDYYDFVYTPTIETFLYPLIGGAILYTLSIPQNLKKFNFIFLLLITLSISLALPADYISYHNQLPLWINPIITAFLWSCFAYMWKYLNEVDGVLIVSAIMCCVGFIFLSWFDGAPRLIGYQAAIIIGGLCSIFIYNKYPSQISLSSTDCSFIGFFIGYILIETIPEKSLPSAIIFSFYPIGEFIYSIIGMLTTWNFSGIISHTAYYQANTSGLSPYLIYRHIFRLNIILLIFGCFELYGTNNYSIPLIASIFTFWYIFRLHNWTGEEQSLKDMNKNIMQELKDGIEKLKNPKGN